MHEHDKPKHIDMTSRKTERTSRLLGMRHTIGMAIEAILFAGTAMLASWWTMQTISEMYGRIVESVEAIERIQVIEEERAKKADPQVLDDGRSSLYVDRLVAQDLSGALGEEDEV
jgi:hypothetical protein